MSGGAVKLRAMEPEDADFIYEIENDQDVWRAGMRAFPSSPETPCGGAFPG